MGIKFEHLDIRTQKKIKELYPELDSYKPKRMKFRNNPTYRDGIRFHSAKEADYYTQLCYIQKAGEIKHFKMQVPFHIFADDGHGNRKCVAIYYLDFEILNNDGTIEYVDCKASVFRKGKLDMSGKNPTKTAEYVLKKKQVETAYGIIIQEV